MDKKRRKPLWWVLYLLLIIMFGALVLEARNGLPSWAHLVTDIGIVLFFFGSVGLWIHVNGPALWEEEMRRTGQESYIVETYDPVLWPPEEDVEDENESFSPIQSDRLDRKYQEKE